MRDRLQLGEGIAFDNGPTCKGVAYPIIDSDNDFSDIEIIGRYPPEMGTYATNNGSREEVDIEEGEGWLYRLRDSGFLSQERLIPGTRVIIEPGEHFAWLSKPPVEAKHEISEGMSLDEAIAQALNNEPRRQEIGMKLAMLCIPAFNPEKYIPSRSEDEIIQANKKEGDN